MYCAYLKQNLGQVAGRRPERCPVALVGYPARVAVEERQRLAGREQRRAVATVVVAAAVAAAVGLVLVGERLLSTARKKKKK